jgi:hypothetical protein
MQLSSNCSTGTVKGTKALFQWYIKSSFSAYLLENVDCISYFYFEWTENKPVYMTDVIVHLLYKRIKELNSNFVSLLPLTEVEAFTYLFQGVKVKLSLCLIN